MRAKARITARGLVKGFGVAAPGVAEEVVEGLKGLVPDDENARIRVADDQAFWESVREEALKEVTWGIDDQAFWESIREEALKGTKEEGTLSDLDYAARHKLGNAISLLGAAASSIRREVDPGAREAEFGRLDSYLKSASDARDEIMNGLKVLEKNRDVIRNIIIALESLRKDAMERRDGYDIKKIGGQLKFILMEYSKSDLS